MFRARGRFQCVCVRSKEHKHGLAEYVYIRMCVYGSVYVCVYVRVHACVCVYTRMYVCVCVHVCMPETWHIIWLNGSLGEFQTLAYHRGGSVCVCMYVCEHTYVCVCTRMYVYVCALNVLCLKRGIS